VSWLAFERHIHETKTGAFAKSLPLDADFAEVRRRHREQQAPMFKGDDTSKRSTSRRPVSNSWFKELGIWSAVSVSMVPGARRGPNVFGFDSNGWRQPNTSRGVPRGLNSLLRPSRGRRRYGINRTSGVKSISPAGGLATVPSFVPTTEPY
jgi:hypothetical protein